MVTVTTPAEEPLKIGLSPRFLHRVPPELGFKGKKLQYLEQSIAHWLMRGNALVFMIPSIEAGGVIEPGDLRIAQYAAALDGLVLQGGADVSPVTYGETPMRPEWDGDRIRDTYELGLLRGFVAAGKPVLGICRGLQLVNVAFGGTLFQDIAVQRGHGLHYDADAYDQHFHDIELVPDTKLGAGYPQRRRWRVNSIHHQAVKDLATDFTVEARSVPDGVIEAIRWNGPTYVAGVQWHPEFHDPADPSVLSGTPILDAFLAAARDAKSAAAADR
ncbi:MAG: gamma-glutamyl-gamma-aminobutyrate hydrolase family protein [Rhodospirillaceae bacterium]